MTDFFRFPRTPHIAWLGPEGPREDKLLSETKVEMFLGAEIVIEEKVDGANIGLRVDSGDRLLVRNRGTDISPGAHPQFGPLWGWIAARRAALLDALGENLVLFGEWCFAVHSVLYSRLPDWFLGFDVYDRSAHRFWSVGRRNELLLHLGIHSVPELDRGRFTLGEVRAKLENASSKIGGESIEGLYLRRDDGDRLAERAKLIRAEFVAGIGRHWSRRPMKMNRLARALGRGGEAETSHAAGFSSPEKTKSTPFT